MKMLKGFKKQKPIKSVKEFCKSFLEDSKSCPAIAEDFHNAWNVETGAAEALTEFFTKYCANFED